jgi:ATP-dependent exoDNAse (exonuclease V) alpha subunit
MSLKGLNLAGISARPKLPTPRVIPVESHEFEKVVETETRIADAETAVTDAIIDGTPADALVITDGTEDNIDDESEKLSRLVDDDFPFDDSQLAAVHGLVQQKYGCLIGAAGTGKTTVTKKLVDMLREGLNEVDMSRYWLRGAPDEKDEYEAPEKLIPSIVMVSFTGRASQMTKKNFPRDWHGNIMTIHRALGFYPEFYPEYDEESREMKYNEENKMPWDIVVIDECGMLGLDLWHQLLAACRPETRIIMIGDINQLPPTHGKSILGFALAQWPTWELTHIHRQQGANNSIVDNAHRILKGIRPISDSPTPLTIAKSDKEFLATLNFLVRDKDWRFVTIEVPEEHRKASLRIRQMLKLLQGKLYEPNRDVVITPINGFEQTAPGYSLGQAPMNQELVVQLNHDAERYFIDAGRERQNFAEGDKVMATINDYEAGVTNGMTGIITRIAENGAYTGDIRRFGKISDVNDYLAGLSDGYEDEDVEFSLEEMVNDETLGEEEGKTKEKKDAGPASHIVTVRFGEGEHAFEINFASKSQVASLMLAYVATCHKMQGGECPLVFVIVHNSNKRPLNREWFYTGVTRASQRCVVLYTKQGFGFALGKQNIKGTTLEAKVKTFVELTKGGLVGAAMKVKLPKAASLTGEVTHYQPKEILHEEAKQEALAEAEPSQPKVTQAERIVDSPASAPRPSIKVGALHIHIHEAPSQPATVDAGNLRRVPEEGTPRPEPREAITPAYSAAATLANIKRFADDPVANRERELLGLPAPVRRVANHTSVPFDGIPMERLAHEQWVAELRIPKPGPKPEPIKPAVYKPLGLGALLAKQRNPQT